jgi:hypothetical protein
LCVCDLVAGFILFCYISGIFVAVWSDRHVRMIACCSVPGAGVVCLCAYVLQVVVNLPIVPQADIERHQAGLRRLIDAQDVAVIDVVIPFDRTARHSKGCAQFYKMLRALMLG